MKTNEIRKRRYKLGTIITCTDDGGLVCLEDQIKNIQSWTIASRVMVFGNHAIPMFDGLRQQTTKEVPPKLDNAIGQYLMSFPGEEVVVFMNPWAKIYGDVAIMHQFLADTRVGRAWAAVVGGPGKETALMMSSSVVPHMKYVMDQSLTMGPQSGWIDWMNTWAEKHLLGHKYLHAEDFGFSVDAIRSEVPTPPAPKKAKKKKK